MSRVATIGLSIIAKNESAVIERCLRSVMPICDYFLVCDTGSTDGTQDVVRAFLAANGLAGEVIERPWQNFAHNRTEAMRALRAHTDIDYCLMIDADEQIMYEDGFDAATFKAGLTADYYDIATRLGHLSYLRPQLTRNALDFSYRGVLHEFVERPKGKLTSETAQGIFNRPTPDGARSSNPNKYQDDAVLLWEILKEEEDPFLRSRYQFYLAQSLRDSHELEASIEAYEGRATMGFWQEEVFISLYEAAKLRERLGQPVDEVIAAFLRAHEANPKRAEALVTGARYARQQGRRATAFVLARRAMELPVPAQALYLEPTAYRYRAKDEAAVSAYSVGEYDACLRWSEELLAMPDLPEDYRGRVAANRDLARTKLRG